MAKLALICSNLSGGGAERVVLNLAAGFRDAGHRVDLILMRAEGEYLKQIPEGITVHDLKVRRNKEAIGAIRRYLNSAKPDAMVVTMVPAHFAAILARFGAKHRCPLWLRVDNTMSELMKEMPFAKRLRLRLLYPLADGAICVSAGVAEDFKRCYRIKPSRVHTIYNPLDISLIRHNAAIPLEHPVLHGSGKLLVAMGRLAAQKDYPMMLRALVKVRSQVDARLVILGVGEQQAALEALAENLGLKEAITFAGFQENPHAWIARADAFVLFSTFEGFGNVLVEAMACGVPVVSTDCPHGPAEVLENGRYGMLSPVGDSDAFAAAILQTLTQEVDGAMLQGRAKAFDLTAIIPQYLALLGTNATLQD